MTSDDEQVPLEVLRSLILAEQPDQIKNLEQRLEALEHSIINIQERTVVVGEVLPAVLRDSGGQDSALLKALQPEVEHAIFHSVRQEPTVIAEAIYPVMGPVIRKIVEKMFESTKGRSLDSYQIEQLFLIHRQSGLIVRHHVADGITPQDADMVAGMLDAIRSFVREAFDAHEFDGLNHMNVGDVNVRIEWSPTVVLAAVVRGIEPPSLQPALQQSLHKIHSEYEKQLQDFDGDSAAFEDLSFELQQVLNTTAPKQTNVFKRHARSLAFVGLLVALISIVIVVTNNRSWQRGLDNLAEQPGIVVVEQNHGIGRDFIRGLLDPDARSPEEILQASGVDLDELDVRWEPFISDDPQVKRLRAERILLPPEGVSLDVKSREIFVYGNASAKWLDWAESQISKIDGIDIINRTKRSETDREQNP